MKLFTIHIFGVPILFLCSSVHSASLWSGIPVLGRGTRRSLLLKSEISWIKYSHAWAVWLQISFFTESQASWCISQDREVNKTIWREIVKHKMYTVPTSSLYLSSLLPLPIFPSLLFLPFPSFLYFLLLSWLPLLLFHTPPSQHLLVMRLTLTRRMKT